MSTVKEIVFTRYVYIIVLLFIPLNLLFSSDRSLRILTVNVWSGLDYEGTCKVGEYESASRREQRFISLLAQIRAGDPDLIFLQEVNPAGGYSSRLADSLGYDEIHQVCNAGIKFLSLGIPSNLNEGLTILARGGYELEKYDVWKLSGSPGVNGDLLNFHFDDAEYALVGKIIINKVPFFLVNVHLFAAVIPDSVLRRKLDSLHESKMISDKEYESTLQEWEYGLERQKREIKELLSRKKELPDSTPVIIAGDFNSAPGSGVIRKMQLSGKLFHTFVKQTNGYPYTWDPDHNRNTEYWLGISEKNGNKPDVYSELSSDYDRKPKTIDYIFLNGYFSPIDIEETKIVMDSLAAGVHPSDHFGVLSEINIENVLQYSPKETDKVKKLSHSIIEPLPVLNYDSDAGFGYGGKVFMLNMLNRNESFDAILFNSTKGERWYRLVFSIPDFDLRQFKKYPLSFDLTVDYDKWINANFFGIGNATTYADKETYTKEPLDISFTFGHAFSKAFVAQTGVKFELVKNSNFSDENSPFLQYPQAELNRTRYLSLFLNFKFDTRNSFTNPSKGSVVQLETEIIPKTKFSDVKFNRFGLWLQHYLILFYPKTVFAFRFGLHSLAGNEVPIQNLLSLGGNSSLRGYPQDRYLDKTSSIINAELRFPVYWRFGGILGVDAGKVWDSISKYDLKNWAVNPALGLRFYMDTFVIRFDVGFGKETTGIYLNFGQLF